MVDAFPPNLTPKPGPLEGTRGIGVGELDPEFGFRSIVWFPYADRAAAETYAAESGYTTRDGVRL